MSEHEKDFRRSFMSRTLEILQGYGGPHETTMLMNCLVGLLILPKEKLIDKIPKDPLAKLIDWGLNPDCITKKGKCVCGSELPSTVRQFVRCLRNAVAHFNVEPIEGKHKVLGFKFSDRNGFQAKIMKDDLKAFVIKIATSLGK